MMRFSAASPRARVHQIEQRVVERGRYGSTFSCKSRQKAEPFARSTRAGSPIRVTCFAQRLHRIATARSVCG